MAIVSRIQSYLQRHLPGAGNTRQWPFIAGKYRVFDPTAPVAIVGSHAQTLAQELAALETPGVCMVAPQCRSATDVEKLVRNIAANLAIHNLLVVAEQEHDAPAASVLLALFGTDVELSPAAAALLKKARGRLDDVDLDALSRQVRAVKMLGGVDVDRVVARVSELASEALRPNTGFRAPAHKNEHGIERVLAASNIAYEHQPDKAGYFYICVQDRKLLLEQYSNRNELLRVIEGQTARDLCITLIRNGWVSKLDHAAYLGRELLRAELAMQAGDKYVQDAARAIELDEEALTRH
ncbi:MAG TPA: DUF4346 domain-containing protein [Gammaproteobacteria bacterium]|nr:DUF4346 domain-containing protein [Gammaproteobacteria bacterium]